MSLFDSTPLDPDAPAEVRQTAAGRAHAPGDAWKIMWARNIFWVPASRCAAQIERDQFTSMILWGPPGVGKTTLARLIARITRCEFIPFSAVLSRHQGNQGGDGRCGAFAPLGRRTILFIDEIHRFNKAQQDAFLPYVERGDIILIGATTENPSFEVISALLSRSRVYALRALTVPEIVTLLKRALPVVGLQRAATICWNRSPSTPTATRARPTTRWKPRPRPRRRRARPSRPCRTPCSARCCSTTRAAKSTST